jgi:uncharacterized protein (DUF2062 family)
LSDPALWRLTNRSVPRGVALGLGIGVIIPVMHIFVAALLAIPLRANVAIAAACTLIINPLTIPPMYYAAYRIGSWELHHDSVVLNPGTAQQVSGELGRLLFWIHEASGSIALGIVTIAAAAAILGYGLAAVIWRVWVTSKWRARRLARRAAGS